MCSKERAGSTPALGTSLCDMHSWRNWYTRSLEEAVPKGVRVRVSPSALIGHLAQLARAHRLHR